MRSRITLVLCAAVAVLALAGCTTPSSEPVVTPPPLEGENPAGGSRLAPGLYDLEDGQAQAVGTVGYSELEGGFWTITGGTQAEGNEGTIVAVIANGEEFASQLTALKDKTVMVTGVRLDGASIRMAGPEIQIADIVELSDTPGAAE